MNNIPALKNCPFCGSPEVTVVGSVVRCGKCSAAGPYALSGDEAARRWNERTGIIPGSSGPGENLVDVRHS
jgi:restriction alleviation protein Lar